jgi:hypothetical protein
LIIDTKYNVGHKFIVPRCFKRYATEVLTYEGEEWKRDVEYYEPLTKVKEIIGIDVYVHRDDTTRVTYKVVTEGDYNTLSQHYEEDAITDYSEEKAMTIAKYYAKKGEEYYGN